MDVLLRSQSTTALPDRLTQINLYPNTFLPLKCARHLATGYTKEECLGSDFENGRTRTAQLKGVLSLSDSMEILLKVKCQQKMMTEKCNCHPSYFNEGT